MTQNGLDHLVTHSQTVQVGGKAAPECMPAVPFHTSLFERWQDNAAANIVGIEWRALLGCKHHPSYRVAALLAVSIQNPRQGGNDWYRSLGAPVFRTVRLTFIVPTIDPEVAVTTTL